MSTSTSSKIAYTIVVIFMIAAGALALQVYIPQMGGGGNITTQQMETLVSTLSPQEQSQLASSDEARKAFAKNLQELLAVGQEAVRLGYENKDPKMALNMELQEKEMLAQQYEQSQQKKNQSAEVSDDDRKKYEAANPKAFETFFAEFAKGNPRAEQASPDQIAQFKKQYEELAILSERAKAEKLDQDPSLKLQMRLTKAQAVASLYANDLSKEIKVTDEDVKKYYDAHQKDYEQVHARHILIATRPLPTGEGNEMTKPLEKSAAKAKADDLLKQVKAGKDFIELAKANTDEAQGKLNGGDLGYFARGKMDKTFEAAAFALQPGQTSDVVESQFGFHIIKVEDRRTAPMDDVRADIEQKVKEEKFKDKIDELVKKSNIQVASDFKVNAPAGGGGVQALPGGMPQGHP